ncbi:MAG: AarF/ABC1/UbiB kinase family protein, partial [Bacteriovoracaceae bacterium]|nr:AarF/ABC1/UbiB kinase family protein [Bacteriovoracaceae bacterium]
SSDDKTLKEKLKSGFEGQVEDIVHELGLMKGSIMKAGQMLSLHAGEFLPEEARNVLKTLENNTYYLEWDQIKSQIPAEWHNSLDIDHEPVAAASLGQVHIAIDKETGEKYAMKIQYKGVKKAIEQDVKALRMLLKMLNLLPKDIDLSLVFEEIKEMLHRETDYTQEAEATKKYAELVKDFDWCITPEVIDEYSTDTVLTTTWLEGIELRSEAVLTLPQSSRNELGKNFMDLFLREIYQWGVIQTDAHFGNFMISKDFKKWILIDFGATKFASQSECENYKNLISACAYRDRDKFLSVIKEMGYLTESNKTNYDTLWEYCELISEPFNQHPYNWGVSDIPDKILEMSQKLATDLDIGRPPGDTVFIDRKVAGVFHVLKHLGAVIDSKQLLEPLINGSKDSVPHKVS